MPRFVLLYHDCPPDYERSSHWDLMLEHGDVLRTWSLARLPAVWQSARVRTAASHKNCPTLAPENVVSAIELGDHRLDYLNLEGKLSGNRGSVARVAEGTYRSELKSPDCWRIEITSEEIAGYAKLDRSDGGCSHWTLECSATG